MKESLTIAVISDMHCRHGGNDSLINLQTFLTTDLDLKPVSRHPVEAIKQTIKQEKIKADILVCPGDISDKMDKTGLFSGWKYLHEIKSSLQANSLFATVGNHDVDSRKKHANPYSFDIIKQLEDHEYPSKNSEKNLHFWSKHFCIVEEENYCILIFNSSYTHTDEKSAEKCIITQIVIDQIYKELSSIKNLDEKYKICLLHHHPDHHSNFDLKFRDGDFLENGDRLIEVLSTFRFNIIIHGHKHEPKLRYSNRTPIFASGSFSSMMNIIDIGAQNTFHLITLIKNKGIIKSWCYGPTKGWTQEEGTYFPNNTGFGSTKNVENLAQECNDYFTTQNIAYISFDNLLTAVPDITFLIPLEQKQLSSILFEKYGLKIYPSIYNKPEFLIKTH